MKHQMVKYLAKLGVLGLLLGGTGTALLLSSCGGIQAEPVYPWTVEPDPGPVEYPGPVELEPEHEMDKK